MKPWECGCDHVLFVLTIAKNKSFIISAQVKIKVNRFLKNPLCKVGIKSNMREHTTSMFFAQNVNHITLG